MRMEQTYNILNFDNKLKGLENRPDYPKEKAWHFRSGKDTMVNYNILSNIDMQEHHFQPPEKRPVPTEEEVSIQLTVLTSLNMQKIRGKAIKHAAQRDYNVLTNRYLEHHEEKMAVNEDITKVEAAKTYWKTRKFDPLVVKFVDDEAE